MTHDQFTLLQDKISVWRQTTAVGPVEFRDYNRRAADALTAALAERANLQEALKLARWYVADHHEAQPNEATASHLNLIDAALDAAK